MMCVFPARVEWQLYGSFCAEDQERDATGECDGDIEATDGENTKIGTAIQGGGATAQEFVHVPVMAVEGPQYLYCL